MRRNINKKSQKGLVRALNRQFTELAQLQRFATAVVATYLATNDSLAICNAAHPRPIWYRAATKTWSILDHEAAESSQTAMNLPFGIDETSSYDQFIVRLEPRRPRDLLHRRPDRGDGPFERDARRGRATRDRQGARRRVARTNLGAALLEKIREHRAGLEGFWPMTTSRFLSCTTTRGRLESRRLARRSTSTPRCSVSRG